MIENGGKNIFFKKKVETKSLCLGRKIPLPNYNFINIFKKEIFAANIIVTNYTYFLKK